MKPSSKWPGRVTARTQYLYLKSYRFDYRAVQDLDFLNAAGATLGHIYKHKSTMTLHGVK